MNTKNLGFILITFLFIILPSLIHGQEWQKLDNKYEKYFSSGEYQKALEVARKELDQARIEFDVGHYNYILSLNNCTKAFIALIDYDQASPFIDEAIQFMQSQNIVADTMSIYLFELRGYVFIQTGRLDEAFKIFSETLENKSQSLGSNNIECAYTYQYIGYIHLYQGDLSEAKRNFLEAERIVTYNGMSNWFSGSVYCMLGGISRELKNYSEAIDYLIQSINHFENSKNQNHQDYGTALNQIGLTYYIVGDYKNAEYYLLQAEKFNYTDLQQRRNVINNLALLYRDQANYSKADHYYNLLIQNYIQYTGSKTKDYAILLSNIAQYNYQRGKYDTAEKNLQESLQITKSLTGNNDETVANLSYMLAEFYYYVSRFRESIPLLIEARSIYLGLYSDDNIHIVNCNNAIAFSYLDLYMPDEAIPYFMKNLAYVTETRYPQLYLFTISGLARSYSFKTSVDTARLYYNLFFETASNLNLDDEIIFTTTLTHASSFYMNNSEFNRALLAAKEALKRTKKTYGTQHPEYAVALNIVGAILYESNDLSQAEKFCSEAKQIIENGNYMSYPGAINAYNNLGLIYASRRQYYDAIINLEQAYSYSQNSIILLNLSELYGKIGNKDKAFKYVNDAEISISSRLGTNHPDYANVQLRLAEFNIDYENYSAAYKNIHTAEQILIAKLGVDCYQLYDCYLMYASYYNSLEQYEEEYQYRSQIVELSKTHFGTDNLQFINALFGLSDYYWDVGNKSESLELLNRATDLARKTFGNKSEDFRSVTTGIAYTLYDFGQFQESDYYFRESISNLIENQKSAFSILTTKERNEYLSNLYSLEFYNNFLLKFPNDPDVLDNVINNRNLVKGLLLESEVNFEKEMRNTSNTLLRESYSELESIRNKIGNSISLPLSERLQQVEYLDSLEHLADSLEFKLSRSIIDKEKLASYSNWEDMCDELEDDEAVIEIIKFYHKKNTKEFLFYGLGVQFDTTGVYPRISYVYPSSPINHAGLKYDDVLTQINSFDIANRNVSQIANLLQCNSQGIALKYLRDGEEFETKEIVFCDSLFLERNYHNTYAAIIFTSETKKTPEVVIFKNGYELENQYYNKYINTIYSKRENRFSFQELYDVYWSKIESKIPNKRIVYISSDGVYNKINIETLLKDTGYIGESKSINYINSLREITSHRNKTGTRSNKHIVLVGNPEFRIHNSLEADLRIETSDSLNNSIYQYSSRNLSDYWLPPLPGTQMEIDQINTLFQRRNWTCTSYSKDSALEERIKEVSNPAILHIATHGLFESNSDDVEVLSDSREAEASVYSINTEAMMRSCLFFAGSQNTINNEFDYKSSSDDGILTAYEILNLNLDSTSLVVLSACETGLGANKDGQGVYGLQRAFKIAGANQVLMSLWNVDDVATQILMTEFYKNWISGKSVRNSLTMAQNYLRNIDKYKSPYYWGAFIVTGL